MTEEFDDVELAVSDVDSYQRRTKSGQVITVKGYTRTDNSAVADRAHRSPGRPAVAASSGRFAGDRSIPVWPDAGKDQRAIKMKGKESPVKYEGIEDTGAVDQDALDKEVPIALEVMKNLPQNPALKKLISILEKQTSVRLSEEIPVEVELAIKSVRISGYSYISKKTGKLVRVDPYNQMRRLMSSMGGIPMAADKGITPDLVNRALPGFDMKTKVFTPEVNKPNAPKALTTPKVRNLPGDDAVRAPKRISLPTPKPNETKATVGSKAMAATHPLQAVRNAPAGSKVVRGKEEWVRGQDDSWYKTPRGKSGPISDKDLSSRLANRGGDVDLTVATPIPRKKYENSKVDTSVINSRSPRAVDALVYTKALGPSLSNMPEGVADSINGHVKVEAPRKGDPISYASITSTRVTKKDSHYPQLIVRPDADYEADLAKALPAQQREGFSAPSDLHPTETQMTYEAANFTEALMLNRAPAKMVDEMYDRLSAAYDKHIKSDDGDYSAYVGRDGWAARMTGSRSQELKDELAEKLSLHAESSPESFLAESWVEFVGKAEPRPLARDMGRAFQKSMDDFSDYLYKNKWVDASDIPEKVFTKTTQRDLTTRITETIEGAESGRKLQTFEVDRDMRSTSNITSTSTQIFDADGKALFDANIYQDNGDAYITALEYPLVDESDMPDGTPDISSFIMASDVPYYENPIDQFSAGGRAEKRGEYADYINQGTALKVIKEIEDDLKTKGVTKAHVFPRAHEDSVLYARAGYQFDPELTDADELRTLVKTLQEITTLAKDDQKDERFSMPKGVPTKMQRQINKWNKAFNAEDSSTWPTPSEIADFGKTSEGDTSPGESVLNHLSWVGIKDFGSPDPRTSVTVTDINEAARNLVDDVDDVKGITTLAKKVAKIHGDAFVNPRASVSGDKNNHTIQIKEGRTSLFKVDVTKNDDGSVSWSNVHIDGTINGARLGFDMMDQLESSYQKAGIKGIRITPEMDKNGKVDPTSAYALSRQGYDWDSPMGAEQVSQITESLNAAKTKQLAEARDVLSQKALQGSDELSVDALQKLQAKIDETVQKMDDELTGEIGAVMEKFNDPNPDNHPVPFELTLLGQKQAEGISAVRATLGQLNARSRMGQPNNARPGLLTPNPEAGPRFPRLTPEARAALPRPSFEIISDSEDVIKEERLWKQKEPSTLDIMLDFDGDPTHDSTFEFVGKQAITFGGYALIKTLEGYWDWANLDRGQGSLRQSSVGLMFILLRLLPASLWRGAAIKTASVMTKKLKSPRPEDWPSQQEMDTFLAEIRRHSIGGKK